MATIGMTSNLLYAFFGGSIGDRLRASPKLRRYQRYGTGTVLGLGVHRCAGQARLQRTGLVSSWSRHRKPSRSCPPEAAAEIK